MASLNKTTLIGYLGSDLDIRYTQSGTPVAAVNLATTERWKDKKSGEQKEHTEWHRLVFFGRIAEIAAEFSGKGSHVYVEGKLRTQKWRDSKGVDRFTTEILVSEFQLLDKKPANISATPPSSENPPFDDEYPSNGN